MQPYRESKITIITFSVFFVALIGYAFFEARGLLRGPQIIVQETVLETREPSVAIKGTTKHIASLSMNGTPVSVTEDGAFDQVYIASKGYNRVVLSAEDKYGHTEERTIDIVYTPASLFSDQESIATVALANPQATSTPESLDIDEATDGPNQNTASSSVEIPAKTMTRL